MRDGTWNAHGVLALAEMASTVAAPNILSMFRVKWSFPLHDAKTGRRILWYPLPYRRKSKAILFPAQGHAWIMRDELFAVLKWIERFGGNIEVEEWNEFIPGNDERPYAFVEELYIMRRQAKSRKEYDILELAIKLCINSLYGKTQQRVGGSEYEPPSCGCPYYGSAITANCRARLCEAALIDPFAVVCFITDGIVATRELKGLERAKEVFEGDTPEGAQINLGDWEYEQMAGGFFLQSGVYHLAHKSGENERPEPRRRPPEVHFRNRTTGLDA
jgi:hypothetical protein